MENIKFGTILECFSTELPTRLACMTLFIQQSLFILQKRAIRIICLNANYKCHTKLLFYQLRSLNVFDIIDLNSLVFMYKAFHNSLPANLL